MTLSSKVVKVGQQQLSDKRVAVKAPIPPKSEEAFNPDITEAVSEVVTRAKTEAGAILEQAELDAAKLRESASNEGQREGFARGRQEGLLQVNQEWQSLRQQFEEPLAWVLKTRNYLERLDDESTLAMAAALTMAVYSRLKLERLDVLIEYIREMVSLVDHQKVTVFLDPSWGPRLKALEGLLQEVIPQVAAQVDDALRAGEMRVEGEEGGVLGGPLISLQALMTEVLE